MSDKDTVPQDVVAAMEALQVACAKHRVLAAVLQPDDGLMVGMMIPAGVAGRLRLASDILDGTIDLPAPGNPSLMSVTLVPRDPKSLN